MTEIGEDEGKVSEKSVKHIIARDGDGFWFHNPQIVRLSLRLRVLFCVLCLRVICLVSVAQRITSASDCKAFVSLMQADRKMRGVDNNHAIRFTVTKVRCALSAPCA